MFVMTVYVCALRVCWHLPKHGLTATSSNSTPRLILAAVRSEECYVKADEGLADVVCTYTYAYTSRPPAVGRRPDLWEN